MLKCILFKTPPQNNLTPHLPKSRTLHGILPNRAYNGPFFLQNTTKKLNCFRPKRHLSDGIFSHKKSEKLCYIRLFFFMKKKLFQIRVKIQHLSDAFPQKYTGKFVFFKNDKKIIAFVNFLKKLVIVDFCWSLKSLFYGL